MEYRVHFLAVQTASLLRAPSKDLFGYNHLESQRQEKNVKSNQIKTVFDSVYERGVNLDRYNRIGHYFLWPEDCENDDEEINEQR